MTSGPAVTAPTVCVRFLHPARVDDLPVTESCVEASPVVWTIPGYMSGVSTHPAGRLQEFPAVEATLQEIECRLAAPQTAPGGAAGEAVTLLAAHLTPVWSGRLRTLGRQVAELVTVVTPPATPVTSPAC